MVVDVVVVAHVQHVQQHVNMHNNNNNMACTTYMHNNMYMYMSLICPWDGRRDVSRSHVNDPTSINQRSSLQAGAAPPQAPLLLRGSVVALVVALNASGLPGAVGPQ